MSFMNDLDAQWQRLCDGSESCSQVQDFLAAVAVDTTFVDYDTDSLQAILDALHAPSGESAAYAALADRVRCLIGLAQAGEQIAERVLIQSFIGVVWRELRHSMSPSVDSRLRPATDELYAWHSGAVAALWETIHAFDLDSAIRPVAALSWAARRSIRKNRRDWMRIGTIEGWPLDSDADHSAMTRSNVRQLAASTPSWHEVGDAVSPALELLRSMRHQKVITDDEYQVVLLHDLDGWKMTEIAEAKGTTAATMRQRRHRALQRLRRRATPEALVG